MAGIKIGRGTAVHAEAIKELDGATLCNKGADMITPTSEDVSCKVCLKMLAKIEAEKAAEATVIDADNFMAATIQNAIDNGQLTLHEKLWSCMECSERFATAEEIGSHVKIHEQAAEATVDEAPVALATWGGNGDGYMDQDGHRHVWAGWTDHTMTMRVFESINEGVQFMGEYLGDNKICRGEEFTCVEATAADMECPATCTDCGTDFPTVFVFLEHVHCTYCGKLATMRTLGTDGTKGFLCEGSDCRDTIADDLYYISLINGDDEGAWQLMIKECEQQRAFKAARQLRDTHVDGCADCYAGGYDSGLCEAGTALDAAMREQAEVPVVPCPHAAEMLRYSYTYGERIMSCDGCGEEMSRQLTRDTITDHGFSAHSRRPDECRHCHLGAQAHASVEVGGSSLATWMRTHPGVTPTLWAPEAPVQPVETVAAAVSKMEIGSREDNSVDHQEAGTLLTWFRWINGTRYQFHHIAQEDGAIIVVALNCSRPDASGHVIQLRAATVPVQPVETVATAPVRLCRHKGSKSLRLRSRSRMGR